MSITHTDTPTTVQQMMADYKALKERLMRPKTRGGDTNGNPVRLEKLPFNPVDDNTSGANGHNPELFKKRERLKIIRERCNGYLTNGDKALLLEDETMRKLAQAKRKFRENGFFILNRNTLTDVVCTHYNLMMADLFTSNKSHNILIPRGVAMMLCQEFLGLSYLEIGRFFNKDHSSVINLIQRTKKILAENKEVESDIFYIRSTIHKMQNQGIRS